MTEQSWPSTGRGGSGNSMYTAKALAKQPVTINAPLGREVYKKTTLSRSGRGGAGNWVEPESEETENAKKAFERDQELIRQKLMKEKSVESGVFKSGRGGWGNIPVTEEPAIPQGQGDLTSTRSGEAENGIPLVELRRQQEENRVSQQNAKTYGSQAPPTTDGGWISTVSWYLSALTPAENRVEAPPVNTQRQSAAYPAQYATYKRNSSPVDANQSSFDSPTAGASSSSARRNSPWMPSDGASGSGNSSYSTGASSSS